MSAMRFVILLTAAIVALASACAKNPRRAATAAPRDPVPETIGESRPPKLETIAAHCRALCALSPDYAGSDVPAPPFELAGPPGAPVSLEKMRGQVIVLHFWSTIAAAAVVPELPEIAKLASSLRTRPGVVVISIAADDHPDNAQRFVRTVLGEAAAKSYPLSLDVGAKVATMYGTIRFPETWIIDRSGILRARFDGRRAWGAAEVLTLLDDMRDDEFCPVEINEGITSGPGDEYCTR
jgi:peroxiredoxin